MNRRDFFSSLQIANTPQKPTIDEVMQASGIRRTNRTLSTGLTAYSGAWGFDEVAHLLRRTMFGAKKDDITYFMGKTMSQAVDELLTAPSTQPSPPINNYNTAQKIDPNIAPGQTWVYGPEDVNFNSQRIGSLKAWFMGQTLNQDRSIHEKMVLFWHNHFSTETNVYNSAIWGYNHHVTLRKNSLGNFKTFVKEITTDVAMLKYLNGYLNTKKQADENYGRELQELFTVGKDLNPHYTEDDVKQAARVLTGWRINQSTFKSYFDLTKHDTTDKVFSSFYNNTTITGKNSATAGDEELDAMLTMIFNHQEVAKFMCRKLYRWFIYYDIDATTETNIIEPLATIFRNNNYDIKPVLEALFKSEHFYDAANMGCLIKSPLDSLIGMCRQFEVVFPTSQDYVTQYYYWNLIWSFTTIQQQNYGDSPNVAGWSAYYQVPEFHEIWINSDTLPKRNQISDVMIAVGVKRGSNIIIIDAIAAAEKISSKPSDPNKLIDDLCKYLHATLTLSQANKDSIKTSSLLYGQSTDAYWTTAWNDYKNNPTDATKKQIVNYALILLMKYLMDLSEYQLS
jgi:uncharacterized protein (DUF1800 family)